MKKLFMTGVLCACMLLGFSQQFTIGTIPDTQNLTENDADGEKIKRLTQWYTDQRTNLNLDFVVSLGDMTQWGAYDQWGRVRRAYDVFKNNNVPYAPCQGNHDPQLDRLNQYFPVSEFQSKPYYGGNYNGMANAYYFLEKFGMKFIIVVIQSHDNHIGFYERSSIDWANSVLDQYPNHRAILVTHDFFEERGLINDIIKKHDNLFLAVCGHSCSREKYWTEKSLSGKTVHCIMTDYQCDADKGQTLRYYTFKPAEDKIQAFTYNVPTGKYERDADSEFSFSYDMEIATVAPPSIPTPTCTTNQAFGTSVTSLPGTIEAENYNQGCQGAAFFDSESTNLGKAFRNDAVDLEVCNEGGYNVGWTQDGEWLNYRVNVSQSGIYSIQFRVASLVGNAKLHIESNGKNLTGDVNISTTSGWQNWKTITISNVALTSGIQDLKLVVDKGGFNINSFSFGLPTGLPPTTPATNASFVFGTIPDSQHLTSSDEFGAKFTKMLQWYASQKDQLNLKFVTSLGDMTNDDTPDQWVRTRNSYNVLKNAGIRYAPCQGNHDAKVANMNQYFPVSEFSQRPDFGGYFRGMENAYYLITESGMDFLIVVIQTHDQYTPVYDRSSIDWANGIISKFPNRRAILVTHDFHDNKGLVNDVIKKHDNLFLAVCGHSPAREAYWTEKSPSGNTVHCIMSDYQRDANKGQFLRYYKFVPLEDKVYAYTYNPVDNYFETDATSQFSFYYDMPGSGSLPPTSTVPSVPTPSNCKTVKVEAENYSTMSGVKVETTTDVGGGKNVGWIEKGDYMVYPVSLPSCTYQISYRVASPNTGTALQLEKTGGTKQFGTITLPNTGGWQNWTTVSHTVTINENLQDFAIVALKDGFNINYIDIKPASSSARVEMEASHEVNLYPNPVFDLLTIEVPNDEQISVRIHNLTGVEYDLSYNQSSPGRIEMDVSTLPIGIYYVVISTSNNRWVRQFVKE